MMLLWVNLHGGFIVGFLFMGIFLSGYFLGFLASNGEERSVSANKGKQLSLVLRRFRSCGMRESIRRPRVPLPLPRGVGNLPDGPCAGIHVPQFS